VFESQLLGSFCKQIVSPLTEHYDAIETQTENCMRSQIAHATPLAFGLIEHCLFVWKDSFADTSKAIFIFYVPWKEQEKRLVFAVKH